MGKSFFLLKKSVRKQFLQTNENSTFSEHLQDATMSLGKIMIVNVYLKKQTPNNDQIQRNLKLVTNDEPQI